MQPEPTMPDTDSEAKSRAERRNFFLMTALTTAAHGKLNAKVRNLSAGGMMVELSEEPDPDFQRGDRIAAELRNIGRVKGEVAWTPVLDIGGKRYPIVASRTVIGRGSDADITVDDTGTSRKHVEIIWDGKRAQVNDLGSTNGSKLNGQPLKQAPLPPDSVIEIGRTRIIFRVLAQAAEVDQFADLRNGRADEAGGRR